MKQIELIADIERPTTLENFLVGKKGVSKRLLTKLKRQEGGITRDGVTIRSIDTVSAGDRIILSMEDDSFLEPNGSLDVPIAFENDSLVVFNKPSGMPS